MLIRGSSSVPDGAEPHAWVNTDVTITWEPSHLYLTQLGFTDTTAPLYTQHHLLWHYWFLKKDTKKMLFPQHFTYPAILTVYPQLKRTVLLPKLGIVFHSTVTCLSNPGRKAVKTNYFFLTCLDLCLSLCQTTANGNWGKFGNLDWEEIVSWSDCIQGAPAEMLWHRGVTSPCLHPWVSPGTSRALIPSKPGLQIELLNAKRLSDRGTSSFPSTIW